MPLSQPVSLSSQHIQSKLTHCSDSHFFIAYSGGVDSHVLLHLCAINQQLKDKITAVYINHGLQAEADNWAQHCGLVCEALGVKFLSIKVKASAKPGESPEEAARNARYAALKPLLGKDDVLMLAQHADDQLETVLLQLFRGSGIKGLSGMPERMAFGSGLLIRPLLDVSKVDIIRYANYHALSWVEDPSNQHASFDRNFLRHDILPLIKQRWPSLNKTVARSARHCADAEGIITALADELLASVINDNTTLYLDALRCRAAPHQSLIIRQWFRQLGMRMPSQRIVQQILRQIVAARADADPMLVTQNRQIRRYRQRLYCILPPPPLIEEDLALLPGATSFMVGDGIRYDIVSASAGIPAEIWWRSTITVRFRSGSERIRLPGRTGTHRLKKLFQEAGIPPWLRETIPLIYLDGKIAAVGEIWIAADFYHTGKDTCLRLAAGQSL